MSQRWIAQNAREDTPLCLTAEAAEHAIATTKAGSKSKFAKHLQMPPFVPSRGAMPRDTRSCPAPTARDREATLMVAIHAFVEKTTPVKEDVQK
eukprot:CAMPEP_0194041178 /NCGR_PEP_ID=MMETSP0009_2-20130614/13075_1 /TAXON_ID=210454 /ORGANISM="Grammatophora oceanica, Strain CCMP 410" /LENGTH=93 /DNA_ID=CAMNT_0038684563 /DNA_START=324 /DNA_END=605 /DNA_ORIENTATION=-